MGRSSTPPAPDYTGAAQATSQGNYQNAVRIGALNRVNQQGPTGSTTWETRPGASTSNPQPGDITQVTSLSEGQQRLLDAGEAGSLQATNAAGDMFGQLDSAPGAQQRLADTLYQRGTRFSDRRFGADEAALRTRLLNSGLAEGSEAYKASLTDFNERKDEFYGDAQDRAVLGAESQFQTNQNNAVNRIASLLQAGRGSLVMPGMGGGLAGGGGGGMPMVAGADMTGAATSQYGAALDASNAQNAERSGNRQAIAGIASAALIAY